MDWVARRKAAEEHWREAIDRLWRDVRISVESACKSFQEQYRGSAEIKDTHDPDHLKLECQMLNASPAVTTQVNMQFHRGLMTVNYFSPHSASVPNERRYSLDADPESAFIVSPTNKQERLTPDDVSCDCLERIFFRDSCPTTGWRNARLI